MTSTTFFPLNRTRCGIRGCAFFDENRLLIIFCLSHPSLLIGTLVLLLAHGLAHSQKAADTSALSCAVDAL